MATLQQRSGVSCILTTSHIGDDGTAQSWDDFENVIVVDEPAYAAIIQEHHSLLLEGFKLPVPSPEVPHGLQNPRDMILI